MRELGNELARSHARTARTARTLENARKDHSIPRTPSVCTSLATTPFTGWSALRTSPKSGCCEVE